MSHQLTKTIFQTWKTYDVPNAWKHGQESVIKMNKTWKYYLLNDHDNLQVVTRYFPWFRDTYINFPYNIQRADAIRYMLLYLYGGVYLDLDYECLRPFDDISIPEGKEIVLIKSINNTHSITNSFMWSLKPNNDFWMQCLQDINNIKTKTYLGKHLAVYITTGPFMLHRNFNSYKNNNTIDVRTDIVLPCNVCKKYECSVDNQNYILKPLLGQSWVGIDTKIYDWVFCNIIIIFIMTIIVFLFIILH